MLFRMGFVTVRRPVPVVAPKVAVMIAGPAVIPEAVPVLEIVATAELLVFHVAVDVQSLLVLSE
jgi:hypothetical protein